MGIQLTASTETVECYNTSQRFVGEIDVEVLRHGNKVWSAHSVAERNRNPDYELPQRFDWYDQQNVGEIGWEGSLEEWADKPIKDFAPGVRRCTVG